MVPIRIGVVEIKFLSYINQICPHVHGNFVAFSCHFCEFLLVPLLTKTCAKVCHFPHYNKSMRHGLPFPSPKHTQHTRYNTREKNNTKCVCIVSARAMRPKWCVRQNLGACQLLGFILAHWCLYCYTRACPHLTLDLQTNIRSKRAKHRELSRRIGNVGQGGKSWFSSNGGFGVTVGCAFFNNINQILADAVTLI